MASRVNGNINIIWNKVGKDNLEKLNELFHIFYQNFSVFVFYKLMDNLKENIDNDSTRKYWE